jgi:hypothetical protein
VTEEGAPVNAPAGHAPVVFMNILRDKRPSSRIPKIRSMLSQHPINA